MSLAVLAVVVALAAQNPAPPGAVTGPAEAVGQTTATLTGTVDPNGSPTRYRFEYGTSTNYGLQTAEASAGDGADPSEVKTPVEGLTPDTIYHYRLVATNDAGTTRGEDRTFRTAAAPATLRAPSVSTGSARDVGPTSARLTASVDPNGSETSVRFDYGTSTRFGSRTPTQNAGAGDSPVSISAAIGGLAPNTRYHYRVVATSAAGTVLGARRTFSTSRQPTGARLSVSPTRVTWGGTAGVTGRLTGRGIGGATIALERQDHPFGAGFTEVRTGRTRSNGTFDLGRISVFVTTRVRVVSRTRIVVASPVVTVSSALRVGARSRSLGRRRARVEGAVWPRVPAGRASLQKQSPTGRWVLVRRARVRDLDANRSRYGFALRRGRRPARYRVVVLARDGGAHVPGTSRELRVRARR